MHGVLSTGRKHNRSSSGYGRRNKLVRHFEPGFLGSNGRPVGLPSLSFLEKLLILRTRVFGNVLKVVVDSGAALSVAGHMIVTLTNAAEQAASYSTQLPHVPELNDPPIMTVCFVGPYDRVQSIMHANVGEPIPRRVRLLRDRYLSSRYESIRIWLRFLRQHDPEYRYDRHHSCQIATC